MMLRSRPVLPVLAAGTFGGQSQDGGSSGVSKFQLEKLRNAAAAGRRHVEIRTLCKETGLDRRFVLQWLKLNADGAERPVEVPDSFSAFSTSRRSSQQGEGKAAKEASSNGPSFSKPSRRFSKAVEDTLEMVFSESPRPSDEVIEGIMDLHRLPKRQVLDWFIERRKLGRKPLRVRKTVTRK